MCEPTVALRAYCLTLLSDAACYNCCCRIGRIRVSLRVKWAVTTSLSSTISEILSLWLWEILHLWQQVIPKSFGKSHVATPHGRKLTCPLHVLPGTHWVISDELHVLPNRLICWKTNVIGDHGTWVKCALGLQLWSTFYPLTVHRSTFYQWPLATCEMWTCRLADLQRVKHGTKFADCKCGRVGKVWTVILRTKWSVVITWIKCGPGLQIWSAFYPLTVCTSAGPHFTNGPNYTVNLSHPTIT